MSADALPLHFLVVLRRAAVFQWNRKVFASERTQQLEMICLRGKRQKRQMMMLFIRFDDTTTAVCHSGRNGAPVPSGQSPKGLGSFHQGSAKESGTVEETRRGMSTFIFHVNHFLLPPFYAYSCSKQSSDHHAPLVFLLCGLASVFVACFT